MKKNASNLRDLLVVFMVFIVFVILSVMAPREYIISQEIIINKPAEQVYKYLKTLTNISVWHARFKYDPNTKFEIKNGTEGEVGFIYSWDSPDPRVGTADQEIIKLQENNRIDTQIRDKKPFEAIFNSFMKTEALNPEQTKLTIGWYRIETYPKYVFRFVEYKTTSRYEKSIARINENLASLKKILEDGN